MKTKTFRLALIQPRNLVRSWAGHWPIVFDETVEPESQQLDRAEGYLREVAAAGASMAVFPELYPGPQSPEDDHFQEPEIRERMEALSKELNLWICYSCKVDDGRGGTFNQTRLVNPRNGELTLYNKLIPASNEPNTPGSDLAVVDCNGIRVGLMICWEMWYPEVARSLRMAGADLIIAPTGGILYELTESWRTVLRARALENNCYVAMTVNTFGVEDGLCELAGPEGPVAARQGEGVVVADIDLERLRFMQETDERIIVPKPYRAVPGLLRWLRPSVVDHYRKVARTTLDEHAALRQQR